jgi:hypothetical protein
MSATFGVDRGRVINARGYRRMLGTLPVQFTACIVLVRYGNGLLAFIDTVDHNNRRFVDKEVAPLQCLPERQSIDTDTLISSFSTSQNPGVPQELAVRVSLIRPAAGGD